MDILRYWFGKIARFVAPESSAARQGRWQDHLNELQRLTRKKDFPALQNKIREAARFVENEAARNSSDSALPEKLNTVGFYFQEVCGDNFRAEETFRKSLQIAESLFGESSFQIAPSLNSLALLLLNQRRTAEAQSLLERLLQITEKHFGKEHPEVVVCLENLSAALRQSGQDEEAAKLRRRAVQVRIN